jgi:hypothetical protein
VSEYSAPRCRYADYAKSDFELAKPVMYRYVVLPLRPCIQRTRDTSTAPYIQLHDHLLCHRPNRDAVERRGDSSSAGVSGPFILASSSAQVVRDLRRPDRDSKLLRMKSTQRTSNLTCRRARVRRDIHARLNPSRVFRSTLTLSLLKHTHSPGP